MDYTYTYTGKGYGLNDAYAKNHWLRRKRKEELKALFTPIIKAAPVPIAPIERCTLLVRFNSRYDCSNCTALEKIFTDCLRAQQVIKDDTNKILYKVCFEYDATLPKQTYQFILQAE